MANDIRKKFEFVGIDLKQNGKYDMMVQINHECYMALRYLLSSAAEESSCYSFIEDCVTLRQSLIDSWEQAGEQAERESRSSDDCLYYEDDDDSNC